MNYPEAIKYFKETYKGWKLSFYLTGGAISISDFLKVPGAGKFIHGIYLPYSEEANQTFVLSHYGTPAKNLPSVSQESVKTYDHVLKAMNNDDRVLRVVASCALTTNRYRRGDNKAYISYANIIWKLTLNKLDEEEHKKYSEYEIGLLRQAEDFKVSQAVLSCITGDKALIPSLQVGESLEVVN